MAPKYLSMSPNSRTHSEDMSRNPITGLALAMLWLLQRSRYAVFFVECLHYMKSDGLVNAVGLDLKMWLFP